MKHSDRFLRLRNQLGLTQRELAGEFQVTHGAIALWENGSREVPGPALRLLSLFEDELGLVDPTESPAQEILQLYENRWFRSYKISKISAYAFQVWLIFILKSIFLAQKDKSRVQKTVYLQLATKLVEELGKMKGLPMKLGQTLSYLAFAMPEEAQEIFARLQTQSPPISFSRIAKIITEELGSEPAEIFKKFSRKPFSAASIGQVHLAKTNEGAWVACKVQYPDIAQAVEQDLKNISLFSPFLRYFVREKLQGEFLIEISELFLAECDYKREAQNQETFRKIYHGQKDIIIPRVLTEYSSARVLCTEYIEGQQFDEFCKSASQEEKNKAGVIIWKFAFKSVLRHNVFQSDPHPGNFLFKDGKVVFLDFGCVRSFSAQFINNWRATFQGVLERDRGKILRGLESVGLLESVEGLDIDHILRLTNSVYEPCLKNQPYTFTDDYVKNAFDIWFLKNPNKNKMTFAREWIFLTRVIWGVGTILSKMNVTANFHQQILPFLYETGDGHGTLLPRPESN